MVRQGLGLSFHTLHAGCGIGTSTASVQCDFRLSSHWNKRLRQVLAVRRIGGASFQAEVRFEGPDGQVRPNAAVTIVTVALSRIRTIALPDDLRVRIQDFLPPVNTKG